MLISYLVVACSAPEKDSKPKKLDTSFLELGELGEIKKNSQINPSDKVIVLDEDQNITILNDGKITIENFDASTLEADSVIVGNSKDKYLFKAVAVQGDEVEIKSTDLTSISEEDSAFSFDVSPEVQFENDDLTIDKVSSSTDTQSLNASDDEPVKFKGNEVLFSNFNVLSISGDVSQGLKGRNFTEKSIAFSGGVEGNVSVDITSGFVKFLPTFRGDYKFSGGKVSKLYNQFDSLVKYKFVVKVKNDGKVSGSFGRSLFKDLKFPVTIPGAVPVYLEFVIKLPVGIKFSLADASETTFTFAGEYALKAHMNYDNENGMNFDRKMSSLAKQKDVKTNRDSGVFQAELFFEPKIQTKIYRLLGPYAYLNASVMADVLLPLAANRDDLYANLSGGVGITFSDPIFEKDILNLKSPSLFNISKGYDVIGPIKKKWKWVDEFALNNSTMHISGLEGGSAALKIRPSSLSEFGKVHITKHPKNGLLVPHENFSTNGIMNYYPFKEYYDGEDSFKISFQEGRAHSDEIEIKLVIDQSIVDDISEGFSLTSPSLSSVGKFFDSEVSGLQTWSVPRSSYSHYRRAQCKTNSCHASDLPVVEGITRRDPERVLSEKKLQAMSLFSKNIDKIEKAMMSRQNLWSFGNSLGKVLEVEKLPTNCHLNYLSCFSNLSSEEVRNEFMQLNDGIYTFESAVEEASALEIRDNIVEIETTFNTVIVYDFSPDKLHLNPVFQYDKNHRILIKTEEWKEED